MKVYSVGANPISYTANSRRFVGTVAQAVDPVVNRSKEALVNIAEDTITAMGKDDATLNYLYKYLPVGVERKLENFDGRRKISVYRGNGYMNKITQRIDSTPPLTFIRHMRNEGTNENPKLVTRFVSLRNPNRGTERINIEIRHKPIKQYFLHVDSDGFSTHKALYDSWRDLKQDVFFRRLAEKFTGIKF